MTYKKDKIKKDLFVRFDSCKGCASRTCRGNQPVTPSNNSSSCKVQPCKTEKWNKEFKSVLVTGGKEVVVSYMGYEGKVYPVDY